ncbi:helix-turn-helix domain-containing protein [Maricurvus nonylphenolicus]|uniref:helix-turn-helix domain-containing protein n=1 Tax=Maricurvus nonylphenolicus TaxID=1008307 RepID=UPI0036F3F4F6
MIKPPGISSDTTIRELLHLGYTTFSPAPAYSDWIDHYWAISADLHEPTTETYYPDGGSSLTFTFEDNADKGIWFNATQKLIHTTFSGKVERFGVRFFPGGIYALLGLDCETHKGEGDQAVSELALPPCDSLFQAMLDNDTQTRIQCFEQWLENYSHLRQDNGPVQHLWPRLLRFETDIPEDLEGQGISRRRFERLFRQQTGITPNKFKMLRRIKQARYLIKSNPELPLTEVAIQCGYFDQAHFNRHFRQLVGLTPGNYKEQQQDKVARQEMAVEAR